MSTEDSHGDLLSKLDPETVAKALERYNKKHSTAGVHTDNGMLSYISSKIKADDSQASTPSVVPKIRKDSSPTRNPKQSVTIPVDQYLYAKYPSSHPSPMLERRLKHDSHRSKSISSIGSVHSTSQAHLPYLSKNDSHDLELQVARNILTDVEFDMESLASGIESEPVRTRDDKMKGIDEWIHGAGKKKRRMSKRERKKSSAIRNQPPVGVVEPRTILSSLDNALDIAEMHKGQGAILEKVSVVTKPKGKLGHTNSAFSGSLSVYGSSDGISEDFNSPESSHLGASVFPNKRKKSSIAKAFIDKALPGKKKKEEKTEKVLLFKFQNPQINNTTELEEPFDGHKLKLEAGESLNEVFDVDSMHSLSDLDDEDIDLENENRIRAKYKDKLEQRRQTIQSTKSNFSHITIVDEQMYDNMTLPKISVSGSKTTRRCSSVNEANEDSDNSTKARKRRTVDEQAKLNREAADKKISQTTMDSVHTVVASEAHDNKSENFNGNEFKDSNLQKQTSLPDYSEVVNEKRQNDSIQGKTESIHSKKNKLAHQDSNNFLAVSNKRFSTSHTIDQDDNWDTRSIRSIRSFVSQNIPGSPGGITTSASDAATEEERKIIKEEELKIERRERFWDYFTFIGSMVWAMLILVVGCVLYAQDIFVHGHKRGSHRTQYYSLFLCIIGIIIFITLIWDINKYISMMKEYWQKGAEAPNIELVEGEDGELLICIPISDAPKKIPQYYGFTTGRHSGSFFLKIGAAVFCVIHIIHLFLIIVKETITLQSNDCCESKETITRNVFHVIYVVLQLFMTFKYSNVIVNRSKGLARFAFMHCIGSSLCFWVNTIIDETMDSLVEKLTKDKDVCHNDEYEQVYFNVFDGSVMEECHIANDSQLRNNDTLHYLKKCVSNVSNWTKSCRDIDPEEPIFSFNVDCLLARECMCTYDNHAANAIFGFGPYLYPFSIEFSILVVGVWYIMWDNIGKVKENKKDMEFLPSARRDSINSATGAPNNEALQVYADCHSTTKGLFAGIILFAFSTTGFIVFLVLSESPDCDHQEAAVTLNDTIEISILLVMIAVSVYLYGWRIARLDVNPNPISFLDDLLLIVCLPSSFFYCILSILPSATHEESDPGNVITQVCMMLQVIVQTSLIVDGLRRCSDGQANQVERPGRNLITFLIVANLSLWLWETMEAKAVGEYYHIRKKYYGAELWTVISHTTLPLSIFYRFHSAVALADIWSSAYKPGDHH